MTIKAILLSLAFSLTSYTAVAADYSMMNPSDITSQGLDHLLASSLSGNFQVKRGEAYDEARDPVMQKEGPETHSPEHGYFAVPLVVISILGILLYFIRND